MPKKLNVGFGLEVSDIDHKKNIRIAKIMDGIEAELRSASAEHEGFHSAHEGWSVILEEVDELWDEVKKKAKLRDKKLMAAEATQVAAMAARFILDLT